jgi:hypothetical protein
VQTLSRECTEGPVVCTKCKHCLVSVHAFMEGPVVCTECLVKGRAFMVVVCTKCKHCLVSVHALYGVFNGVH